MYVYDSAAEPKELLLCHGAGHVLDEVADEIHDRICTWLVDNLSSPSSDAALE
jgi:hypothetical protein